MGCGVGQHTERLPQSAESKRDEPRQHGINAHRSWQVGFEIHAAMPDCLAGLLCEPTDETRGNKIVNHDSGHGFRRKCETMIRES